MRHRFHAICPYFAMFPEQFVEKHLIWSKPGDVVLDPFSGRGTTVFQSLLQRREALGGDTNPVAVCVSRAKADPPELRALLARIVELERLSRTQGVRDVDLPCGEFFSYCFHRSTLQQIEFLRQQLAWRRTQTDRFVAALALGCLHGESHRTEWCFSNRMPRTISTKPAYSVRWWREHGYVAPKRDVFAILRAVATFRYESPLPPLRGRVAAVDARKIADRFADAKGRVGLVITSPPYLDTTDYREDQWLRLWLLGGPERPEPARKSDDRHRHAGAYWKFLAEAWAGMTPLLRDGAHLIVRIGGRHIDSHTVGTELRASLQKGTGASVRLLDRRVSRITHGQVHSFRPGVAGTLVEHDFHFRIT